MADGTTSEREVCVREDGNDPDAVDTVDIWDDLIVSVVSALWEIEQWKDILVAWLDPNSHP